MEKLDAKGELLKIELTSNIDELKPLVDKLLVQKADMEKTLAAINAFKLEIGADFSP
jgi:hypothetical protein